MIFAFIFFRILFIACMVFIIGYVFGPFARNRTFRVITRVAAILAVVPFSVGQRPVLPLWRLAGEASPGLAPGLCKKKRRSNKRRFGVRGK